MASPSSADPGLRSGVRRGATGPQPRLPAPAPPHRRWLISSLERSGSEERSGGIQRRRVKQGNREIAERGNEQRRQRDQDALGTVGALLIGGRRLGHVPRLDDYQIMAGADQRGCEDAGGDHGGVGPAG